MAELTEDGRGVLYPGRLPTFHRHRPPAELAELIGWFWIPRWQLAPGEVSRQELLPFPASNLVVEPHGVGLSGPTTGASHRDLRGTGWAVGALLRPAAIGSVSADPRQLCDTERAFVAPDLYEDVHRAMQGADEEQARHDAVDAYSAWALKNLRAPDEHALAANRLEELIAGDRNIMRVEQVAERLEMSVRGVQRLAQRYIGLPPLAIIRRYRLQEAAQRLREDSSLTIARVAADLGYADHAHLTADFRRVLGSTPSAFRNDSEHTAP